MVALLFARSSPGIPISASAFHYHPPAAPGVATLTSAAGSSGFSLRLSGPALRLLMAKRRQAAGGRQGPTAKGVQPVQPPTPARAASGGPAAASPSAYPGGVDWAAIAACEASGNWHLVDPPFYGGLQFLTSTWLSSGGGRYAPRADQATPAEQIAVAQRLGAGAGLSPWPYCGKFG